MVSSSGALVKRELTSKEHKISSLCLQDIAQSTKLEESLIFGDRMENLNKKRREIVIVCVRGGDNWTKRATGFVNLSLEDRKVDLVEPQGIIF